MNYILETVGLTHQGFLKLRDKYFEWQENTQNDENDVNDNDNDNENDIGDKNDNDNGDSSGALTDNKQLIR